MKAIEITLSDGRAVTLHEITNAEFGLFLSALPALQKMGDVFGSVQDGGNLPVLNLEADALLPLWKLIAHCCNEEVETMLSLPVMDGMTLFAAIGELLPKNFMGQPPAAE